MTPQSPETTRPHVLDNVSYVRLCLLWVSRPHNSIPNTVYGDVLVSETPEGCSTVTDRKDVQTLHGRSTTSIIGRATVVVGTFELNTSVSLLHGRSLGMTRRRVGVLRPERPVRKSVQEVDGPVLVVPPRLSLEGQGLEVRTPS